MNLIEDIEKFFSLDEHFDDFTKIRYIYLYICKVFSYDTRFYNHNPAVKAEIYNTPVNVTNVKNFEAVCSTISNALVEILNHFGYETEVVKEESDTFSHVYTIVKFIHNGMEYKLRLDPTLKHDVTRVKLDSPTLGFTDEDEHNDFIDAVIYSDKVIKTYLDKIDHDEHYTTIKIKELNTIIEESARNRNITDRELFYEKLEYIMCLINIRKDLKYYSDIDYYYSYLLRNLQINNNANHSFVRPAIFYNLDNSKDIICLSMVAYANSNFEILLLNKDNDSFKIKRITKEEAMNLLENYVNYDCSYLFEQFIQKMPNTNNKTL